MPKIFERDGYRFFFYTNEHPPIHAHLRYGGGEAVFDVEERVELRGVVWLKSSGAGESPEACRGTSSAYHR
jgi:Domain of unknown function (DUF4160)